MGSPHKLVNMSVRIGLLLGVVVVAAVAAAAQLETAEDAFHSFTLQFSKDYPSQEERELRRAVFMRNYENVIEHNKRYEAKEVSWYKKIHADSDLTLEEWKNKRLSSGIPHVDENTKVEDSLDARIQSKLDAMKGQSRLRDFDWVSQGAVSSVKDQGRCGSCAAFSAVGSIESCFKIQSGSMNDDLSEQHLLDCGYNHEYIDDEGSWGADGCDGAWPQAYYDWIEKNGQLLEMEDFYRYVSGYNGENFQCNPRDDGFFSEMKMTGMWNKWYTNEQDMENVVQINPVSTSVQATTTWYDYAGGVLDDPQCCDAAYDSECVYNLNHAILVVGYGYDDYSGEYYWLIKNSWADWWGDQGFLKLKKGTGHCGVGSLHQTIPNCETS